MAVLCVSGSKCLVIFRAETLFFFFLLCEEEGRIHRNESVDLSIESEAIYECIKINYSSSECSMSYRLHHSLSWF